MDKSVREIYEGECAMQGAKYLLIIYDDGTLKLTWYCGDRVLFHICRRGHAISERTGT
jgi:hypothetical protein